MIRRRWLLEMRPNRSFPWIEVKSYWFLWSADEQAAERSEKFGFEYRVVDRREREQVKDSKVEFTEAPLKQTVNIIIHNETCFTCKHNHDFAISENCQDCSDEFNKWEPMLESESGDA